MSFPKKDAFSEGLVVEFTMDHGNSWVGNFAKTWEGWATGVYPELGPHAALVVAGGAGYIVDADERRLVRELGSDIKHVWFQPELGAFIVSNELWFEAFDASRTLWRSRRFSWDEIRNMSRDGLTVTGEAYDPTGADAWRPFSLNLENGEVAGGSYNGPPM